MHIPKFVVQENQTITADVINNLDKFMLLTNITFKLSLMRPSDDN